MTATSDFWKAFARVEADDSVSLRFRCFSGCAALEFTLLECWRHELLAEWGELMTLAQAALEERDTLTAVAAATARQLSHDQWMRKLEMFIELRDPARYQPTFSDVAALWALKQHVRIADPECASWICALVELELIRANSAPEARAFNETEGRHGLALLNQTRVQGQKFSSFFADSNSEKASHLRAA